MGRRKNVPSPVYVDPYEGARRSSILDASPLVEDQFCRPPKDGQPAGPAERIPVRRSYSWQTRHGDHEDDV